MKRNTYGSVLRTVNDNVVGCVVLYSVKSVVVCSVYHYAVLYCIVYSVHSPVYPVPLYY